MPAVTASDIRYRTFAGVTNAVLRAQAAKYPACSVEFKDGYEFRASPSEAYVNLSGGYGKADGFRLLASHEFPKDMGITFGAKYRTWGLNPPVYCAHLLRRFQLKGGKTLKRTLVCAEEAFSLARNVETVVNCSGFGFGDPNVFPIRGQFAPLWSLFGNRFNLALQFPKVVADEYPLSQVKLVSCRTPVTAILCKKMQMAHGLLSFRDRWVVVPL